MFTTELLLVVGLFVITVGGVSLMISGSRGKDRVVVWSQFRVHLGAALLISAITIALIDVQVERGVEARVAEIPHAVRAYICGNDAGLERTVNEQIIRDPIRFSNVVIDAELRPGPKTGPNSKPAYSEWSWTTEFDVRNISDAETPWDFRPNASSDLENEPMARIGKPIVKEAGQDEDLISATDYDKKYSEGMKATDFEAEYETRLMLKPGVTYRVVVARFVHDRLPQGYMSHYFSKITSGVKFNLRVDPDLFDAIIVPYYPGGKRLSLQPTLQLKGSNRFTSYTTSETLLPYQGLEVYWKYKGK